MIGEHQASILPTHEIDAAGQFVKQHLEQGATSFGFRIQVPFLQHATDLCDIVPDNNSPGGGVLVVDLVSVAELERAGRRFGGMERRGADDELTSLLVPI